MSYDYGYQEPKPGIPLAGKIAIGCMATAALLFAVIFGLGMYARYNFNPDEELEEVLKLTPEAKGFADAARSYFPADYAKMREQAIEAIKRDDKRGAQQMMMQFVKTFIRQHAAQAAAAGDKPLLALLNAQVGASGVADTVRGDCLNGAGIKVPQKVDLTPAQSTTIEAHTRRFVEAAAAGRDHPQGRIEMTYSDQQMLQTKVQSKGIAWSELIALDNPVTSEPAALRRCHVSHLFNSSLQELPQNVALRIFANIVRNS